MVNKEQYSTRIAEISIRRGSITEKPGRTELNGLWSKVVERASQIENAQTSLVKDKSKLVLEEPARDPEVKITTGGSYSDITPEAASGEVKSKGKPNKKKKRGKRHKKKD